MKNNFKTFCASNLQLALNIQILFVQSQVLTFYHQLSCINPMKTLIDTN